VCPNPGYPKSVLSLTGENELVNQSPAELLTPTNNQLESINSKLLKVQNFEFFYFGTTYYTGDNQAHQIRYHKGKDPTKTNREISDKYLQRVTGNIPLGKAGIAILIENFQTKFILTPFVRLYLLIIAANILKPMKYPKKTNFPRNHCQNSVLKTISKKS